MDLPTYRVQQIKSHNEAAGWTEWGYFRFKVYDVQKIIDVFEPIIEQNYQEKLQVLETKREEYRQEHKDEAEEDEDGITMDELVEMFVDAEWEPYNMTCKEAFPKDCPARLYDCFQRLPFAMTKEQYDQNIGQCVIGILHTSPTREDIRKFRDEVNDFLDELVRDDSRDELSPVVKDYLHQVQRWVFKYGNTGAESDYRGDPNVRAFVLPDGIRSNPGCLRPNLQNDDTAFDTEISEGGAWEMIPANLIGDDDDDDDDDDTTDSPREESRRDPVKMKKRREELMKRFQEEYGLGDEVLGFLSWADMMEDGERKFKQLCQ